MRSARSAEGRKIFRRNTEMRNGNYSEDFKKARVREYLRGKKTAPQIGSDYGLSRAAITKWTKQYSDGEIRLDTETAAAFKDCIDWDFRVAKVKDKDIQERTGLTMDAIRRLRKLHGVDRLTRPERGEFRIEVRSELSRFFDGWARA